MSTTTTTPLTDSNTGAVIGEVRYRPRGNDLLVFPNGQGLLLTGEILRVGNARFPATTTWAGPLAQAMVAENPALTSVRR